MCDHLDVIYGCFSYANTNLVVGNTIQHWVTVMGRPQKGTEQEGMGTSIQAFLPLFYADDGIVASSESARCQGAFDALTGLFDCTATLRGRAREGGGGEGRVRECNTLQYKMPFPTTLARLRFPV